MWTDENPIAFSGLVKSRVLYGKLAAELANTELSDEDVVALSIEVDLIIDSLRALAESLVGTIDQELENLLGEQE